MFIKEFIFDQITPLAIYSKISELFSDEVSFLFESAENSSDSKYSFIAIGAKERLIYKNSETTFCSAVNSDLEEKREILNESPFEFLKKYYKKFDSEYYKKFNREHKIGFSDGFIGYIGYDSVALFEPSLQEIMSENRDELNIPDIDLVRPKISIVFSHRDSKIFIISSIENIKLNNKIYKFNELFSVIQNELESDYKLLKLKPIKITEENIKNSGFEHTKEKFFELIEESRKHILAGDIFQILISNRFTQHVDEVDPFSFYRVLRSKNPSPYMFFMNFKDFYLVGSSPEIMIKLQEDEILLRPIAGTRKRGNTFQRDKELEEEMLSDPKERAEHVMLIDLGRNDVGRVAKKGTVKVPNVMRVERYSHVMHMVSDVVATLDKEKYDMFDLLGATFTAGTMTGAPKIKAMELIAKFEKLKRNHYSGAIGYFGFDGNMDTAITIRTAMIQEKKIVLHAGAGIVVDSKLDLEYLEVNNKLKALIMTIEDLKNLNSN
jgi:anthranilate synthase component 1